MKDTFKRNNSSNKLSKKYAVTIGVLLGGILLSVIFFYPSYQRLFKFVSSSVSQFATVLSSVLALETNDYRKTNAEQELIVSDLLTKAAQMKADDMAAKSYFSHTGPLGEKPWVWFERVGYKYSYAGENLAVDYTESSDVTQGWINSAKHKANLLNKNFTELGIGIAEGTYNGHPTTYVVQFFAKPAVVQVKQVATVNTAVIVKEDIKIEEKPVFVATTTLASVSPEVAVTTHSDLPDGVVLGEEVKNTAETENNNSKTFVIVLVGVVIAFMIIFKVVMSRKEKKLV
jgi:uncharacterized protein YkwD